MTTIPIEVIVQDAEAPVVPGEDGTNNTETNITVPDTGTISSNGDTSSSASSIILPAILLVLAIGSIIAILIHKYHKQKKDKTSRKEKLAVATSSTIAVLAATVLVSNLILPATKAATSDITDGIVPAEDKISITVTRDGSSAEASVASTATIASSSDFGYKVLLSMAEGVETSNLYLDGDEASEHYIAATESTELGDNTWGYALTEDGEYSAIPLLDDAVVVTQGDEPVEGAEMSVYYGVKVDKDIPVGVYSGEVEYILEEYNGFPASLTTMQGMTTEICDAVYTPSALKTDGVTIEDNVPTATLRDIRDNKTYTIAKLADGKCWMTQNLDLDLSTEVTLTPADTNIANNWTPERKTIEPDDLAYGVWMNDAFHPYSYDPGDIYYYTSGTDADDIKYNSLAGCETAGHTDCSHYHAGNYYNWSAAVASNDTSDISAQYQKAPGSICPSAWRLPLGPNLDDTSYSEITSLLEKYDTILGDFQPDIPGYYYLQDGFRRIRISPFWYNMPGQIVYGSVSGPTRDGYYLTGMVGDRSDSNDTISESNFKSSRFQIESHAREYGHLIRCVAE